MKRTITVKPIKIRNLKLKLKNIISQLVDTASISTNKKLYDFILRLKDNGNIDDCERISMTIIATCSNGSDICSGAIPITCDNLLRILLLIFNLLYDITSK